MHFSDCLDVAGNSLVKQQTLHEATLKRRYSTATFRYTWKLRADAWKGVVRSAATIGFAHHGFCRVVKINLNSRRTKNSRSISFTTSTRTTDGYRERHNRNAVETLYPTHLGLSLYTDDELTVLSESNTLDLATSGSLFLVGRPAANLASSLGEGQWVVVAVRATAKTERQLVEPIIDPDDVPDAIPENLDSDPRFRFRSRCTDYLIRCRGGSVAASAHVLAVRSAYFKRLLTDPSTAESQANAHTLDYPLEIVSPLLTFIQTDTFFLYPATPLRSVLKMLRVIPVLEPSDEHKLRNGLCVFLHKRFCESERSVHDLALIAAVALELPFERLAVCALKLLANDHYVAFREHYTELTADLLYSEVYRILATDRVNGQLFYAHDEQLLFDGDEEPFRPLTYIERVNAKSLSTQLTWSDD